MVWIDTDRGGTEPSYSTNHSTGGTRGGSALRGGGVFYIFTTPHIFPEIQVTFTECACGGFIWAWAATTKTLRGAPQGTVSLKAAVRTVERRVFR